MTLSKHTTRELSVQFLKNIVTGRAALIAFAISILAALRLAGVMLPADTNEVVTKFLDTGLVFLATAIGGAYLHKAAPPASAILLFMMMPTIGGCSSFLHLKDEDAQAVTCGITGAVLPAIEAIAAMFGFPVSVIEALYTEGCETAAKQGMTQEEAQKYGLAHAKTQSARLKKLGARFEPEVAQ